MSWKLAELRSANDWRMAYRRCGLPAHERDGFVELRTDEWTSALVLPEWLARNVFDVSPTQGPVLVRAARRRLPCRWRFFTWLDHVPSSEALADIERVGGFLPEDGTSILMPTGAQRTTIEGWWVRWPGKDLPTVSELMETTRTVLTDPHRNQRG